MINKILKVIEEHVVLDRDLQKALKAEYPYKEILASDIDDLFSLYIVSHQRELLLAIFDELDELPMGLNNYDREEVVENFISNNFL